MLTLRSARPTFPVGLRLRSCAASPSHMSNSKNPVPSKSEASEVKEGSSVSEPVMPYSVWVETVTFSQLVKLVLTAARWTDILSTADQLAKIIDDSANEGKDAIREKTLSSQLRKVAVRAPHAVASFRLAIVSYQLAGQRSNPTQNAELAAKLPTLRKLGTLKANELSFGGIALPPSMGEF